MAQLLREYYQVSYDSKVIKEDREKNGGKLMLVGVIQRADCLNQNKRVYPYNVLSREVTNYQKAIRENRAMGELDHPSDAVVSLEKVSHVLREIWWDQKNVYGRIEVLKTPRGQILETLIDSGVTIGISSRGVGSTKRESAGDVVQDDFQLVCFDIVSEPSTSGAYLNISEAKSISVDPHSFLSKQDRVYRALNEILLRRQ
jgi:hypothetical protein